MFIVLLFSCVATRLATHFIVDVNRLLVAQELGTIKLAERVE